MTQDGQSIYRAPGDGSGFGDIYLVANALLRDSPPSSNGTRVAARIALNVAGRAEFTGGNFAGLGVSLDRKFFERVALHGDVRANIFLDRVSQWGLPLKRASFAFSAGPELKLASNSSLSLQIDGGTTPYVPTGTMAFDEGYGDATFGLSHRFRAGQRHLVGQIYVRENLNLPAHVRWNTDPDMSVGMKITIQ